MFHGTDKIHEFIRQASSLHIVNSVYFVALVVLTLFSYSAGLPDENYPWLMPAVSAGLLLLLMSKLIFHCTHWLSKSVTDAQFELLVAAGNAIVAYAIVSKLQMSANTEIVKTLLDSFLPMALFVLITPLTWRKQQVRYDGFYGFVEWTLLLSVICWLSTSLWHQLQIAAWFGLLSNVVVLLSPVFVRAIRQRHVKKLHDKMHVEIYMDPLTKISNRKHFYDFYDRLREKNKRHALHGDGLAVLFVDIDYFKQYNDHYGHEQGDECLHQVAQFLKALATEVGLSAFRLGGEEFVLCGMVSYQEWASVFENKQISLWMNGELELQIPHVKSPKGVVTLSAGASFVARESMYSLNAVGVTQQADTYLYHAKEQGRSRLCVENRVEAA